jgi:hypothetical protein
LPLAERQETPLIVRHGWALVAVDEATQNLLKASVASAQQPGDASGRRRVVRDLRHRLSGGVPGGGHASNRYGFDIAGFKEGKVSFGRSAKTLDYGTPLDRVYLGAGSIHAFDRGE